MKSSFRCCLLLVGALGVCGFQTSSTLTVIRPSNRRPAAFYKASIITKNPFLLTTSSSSSSSTKLHASIPPEVWTSLLPTCLGYISNDYAVSYGYGFAVSLTTLSIVRKSSSPLLFPWHAWALVCYGFRLNLFLFIRTLLSSNMQELTKRIEDRAKDRGNRFKTRTPLFLTYALLYYGLAVPVKFTSQLSTVPLWASKVLDLLIGTTWFGFGIAALGDFTKTFVKQTQKNENSLVTSGIFKFLRHPNYTGEIIGWTASNLCGLVAVSLLMIPKNNISISVVMNVVLMTISWIGILFVLLMATRRLEEQQKTKYGSDPKYQSWMISSWGGWQLPSKKKQDEEPETPKIELDKNQEEDSGSGI